ncbi:helix-turn-helix domain-containing protein [Streptomyces sp. TR06-5]|uniref:helix-turn-helix domain-containing protein n=1 Tax=unclassified Streptomyces TaxID=2593676 RepID=UPI0039A1010C
MPDARSAPTVGHIVLGLRLRDLRERAGLGFDQAAEALSVNPTTVRRMEKAEVGLKPVYVEKLLQVYGTEPDERLAFLERVGEVNGPGWWHRYRDLLPGGFGQLVSLEGSASLMRAYEPHCVPDLLQTDDYARALLRVRFPCASEEELERRLALRAERATVLTGSAPARLWAVVDETVLRRPVGDRATMQRQLDGLAAMTELPHVAVQVLTFSSGAHPGTTGPFLLFRFDIPELPDLVYAENPTDAVCHDSDTDTSVYRALLDRMCAQAAPLSETGRILREARRAL